MFTGIVQAMGKITAVVPGEGGVRLTIDAGSLDLSDVALGDSLAVQGVCLTVIERQSRAVDFDVSSETLGVTVGLAAPGAVNLEKSLRLSDRLGGHLVSGHVDGIGTVVRWEPAGDNQLLEIEAPADLARYIARKGSITVNGVSLTTNTVDGARFTINLIPHTLAVTTLGALHAAAQVNLEVDLLARYLERLQQGGTA
jgi:riboflavin synthase